MLEFTNQTMLTGIVPYIATSCTERQEFNTSRFHSYNRITTWTAITDKATNHRQEAQYDLIDEDYDNLIDIVNTFSDARYPLYAPEYYLAQRCTYANNVITIPTPPWAIAQDDICLIFTGSISIAFVVTATSTSLSDTNISGAVLTGEGQGLFMPLRKAAAVGATTFESNLKQSTGTIRYEFETPRDYTVGVGTAANIPLPRNTVQRSSSLPDSEFEGRRVRGRRGAGQQRDNAYRSTYEENLDVRSDYTIKTVFAKALTTTSLVSLYDDQNSKFDAMFDSNDISINYSGYTYRCDLNYSRRTLKV